MKLENLNAVGIAQKLRQESDDDRNEQRAKLMLLAAELIEKLSKL